LRPVGSRIFGRTKRLRAAWLSFLSKIHARKIDLCTINIFCKRYIPEVGDACRVRAGHDPEIGKQPALRRAVAEGKALGRPDSPRARKSIREALAAPGRPGVREIAKQFGVAPNTVQRISRPFEAGTA